MSDDERVSVYSADADLRHPAQFARELKRALLASREPARRILVRDLRSQYRQTALGYAWIVLPPVATTLAWIFLNNAQIVDSGDTEVPYAIFVLVGTLLWQGLVDGFQTPLRQLSNSTNVLTKVNFPTESLFLAGFAEITINAFVRLLLLAPVFLWYGVVPTGWLVLAPVGMMSILLLGYGLGLLLTPIGMLYHDVPRAQMIAITFWFLVTPVAYVTPTSGIGATFQRFNPAAPLVTTTRDWLTVGTTDLAGFAVVSGLAVLLVAAGMVFTRVSIPHLIDRLAS